MKKVFEKCLEYLIIALCIPLLGIAAIVLFLYLPVDYVRYKTSQFGREVREKYAAWKGLSGKVKLYNGIRRAGLPINYKDGHFLYGKVLILHDIGGVSYREETGEWIMDEGDEQQETTLAAYAEEQLAQALNCERAVFLVERENVLNGKDLPEAERCEAILLYEAEGRNSAVNVLRAWIGTGA